MTTIILKSEYKKQPINLELSLPLMDLNEDLIDYITDELEDGNLEYDEVISFLLNNDKAVSLEYHINDEPVFTTLKNLDLNQYHWLSVLKFINGIESTLEDMYDPVINLLEDLEKHDNVFTELKDFILKAHKKNYFADTFVNPQTILDTWFDLTKKHELEKLTRKSN
nr:MAG TPA: hypothetical protein [Caudoviricetes sp.]